MQAAFAAQRRAFEAERSPALAVRLDRLRRLEALTTLHERDIARAISADFGSRSAHETTLGETLVALAAIRHARRHLRRWMKPRRARTRFYFRPGYGRIVRQPLGVAGIVSPWNYAFQLAMCPAAAALAAGNRVMIKPSEVTPRFSELLAAIVEKQFAPDEITVVTGDRSVAQTFVRLPFDHLLFTGSTEVGRDVAIAAAANLTPVTLELGGKSPAIVDGDVRLDAVARRLMTGKLFNAGQTCVAPDYALVRDDCIEPLLRELRASVAAIYPTLAANTDYTSIVDDRHYARVQAIIEDARAKGARVMEINPAGEPLTRQARKIAPTVLVGVDEGMRAMQEEIFGPVLPIVGFERIEDAIAYVNRRPRPLALYFFGDSAAHRDRVLSETVSGGVTVNGTLWHYVQEDMPFGGVGKSGYGAYHGEAGFRTFSNEKAVFYEPWWSGLGVLRPPYGRRVERVIALLRRL